MRKRNSPHQKKVSMGYVRETPHIKKENQHGMCKRNCPHKNNVSMGCERETPHIKIKSAWDV